MSQGIRGFDSPGKRRQKSTSLPDRFPREIEAGAFEGGYLREGRVSIGHRRERRIEGVFVSAEMVLVTKAAGGNLDQVASFHRSAARFGSGANGYFPFCRLNCHTLLN